MAEPPFETLEVAPEVPASGDSSMTAPTISIRSILLSILLSLGVLTIISVVTFEVEPFRAMLHNLNPWMLALAGITVVLRVFFGGWRLNYVSHGRLGLMGGIRGQLAWDFFSNVTPSTIGGGPIASGYIARDSQLPLGEATSIMLFSMLLDQIWFALSIPAILGLGFYLEIIPRSLGAVGLWSFTIYFLGFMVWVIIFGYSTLFRPQLLEKLVDRVCRIKGLRRFHEGALNVMSQLQRRALILRSQRLGFYLKGFFLTLLSWLNRYLLVVFIIWSVYPSLDKVLIFLRTIALTLGSVVLPTPGGAGGLEGLYALLLGPLVPEALVAPTLLTWRLLGYYIFIGIGAFLTMDQVQKTIRRRKIARTVPSTNSDTTRHNGTTVAATSNSVEETD